MYPKKWCQAATFACILIILVTALALLAGPADAQETPCPWPTAWATAVATEIASTQRQTLIMRPVCAPVTPAPAVEAARDADAALPPMAVNWLLFAELLGMALCVIFLFGLAAYSLRRWVFGPKPRTLGEQMGVYERGGGGGE